MAHRFKTKALPGSQKAKEREISRRAAQIPDQASLDRLLGLADPAMRREIFHLFKPHLKFKDAVYTFDPPKPDAVLDELQARFQERHAKA